MKEANKFNRDVDNERINWCPAKHNSKTRKVLKLSKEKYKPEIDALLSEIKALSQK